MTNDKCSILVRLSSFVHRPSSQLLNPPVIQNIHQTRNINFWRYVTGNGFNIVGGIVGCGRVSYQPQKINIAR